MLRGVETNPGDAESEQKVKTKISVVEDAGGDVEMVKEQIEAEQS
jgi:hypothetical protein